MQLFLSVTPQEERDASRFTKRFAHVAYRIGPESSLLRRDLLLETRGGLLSLGDLDAPVIGAPGTLAAAAVRECQRREYSGVLLDFESAPRPDRRAFVKALSGSLRNLRRDLFVPESYAFDGGTAVITTALSGGNLTERLRQAIGSYGAVALDLQRLMMDFPLPSPSGEGTPLTREALRALRETHSPAVFFSQELCARYFTYSKGGQTHFVLYDDGETLTYKLRLGQSLGIAAAFAMYPEVSDLLEPLFPRR